MNISWYTANHKPCWMVRHWVLKDSYSLLHPIAMLLLTHPLITHCIFNSHFLILTDKKNACYVLSSLFYKQYKQVPIMCLTPTPPTTYNPSPNMIPLTHPPTPYSSLQLNFLFLRCVNWQQEFM